MTITRPLNVFTCYAPADNALRERLETHLALLESQKMIAPWHDRMIEAGCDWAEQTRRHWERADVILLLVSSDFLASKHCNESGMRRIMERHETGGGRVIPVILRPCEWRSSPLGKLQPLPEEGKAVTAWRDRDAAFTEIARGIRMVAETMQSTPAGASTEQPANEKPRESITQIGSCSASLSGAVQTANVAGSNNTITFSEPPPSKEDAGILKMLGRWLRKHGKRTD